MLLLSQKDCEGIRFYFCKNPYDRNSVAAVGVRVMRDKNGAPILDANNAQIAQDIGIKDSSTSILASNSLEDVILNMEVGPPYDFGNLVKDKKNSAAFLNDLRKGLF